MHIFRSGICHGLGSIHARHLYLVCFPTYSAPHKRLGLRVNAEMETTTLNELICRWCLVSLFKLWNMSIQKTSYSMPPYASTILPSTWNGSRRVGKTICWTLPTHTSCHSAKHLWHRPFRSRMNMSRCKQSMLWCL